MSNINKYNDAFCETFEIESDTLEALEYQSIQAWDSVGHMALMATLEESFEIEIDDHASDVYRKVILSGKKLVRKYIPLAMQEKAPRTKQKEEDATFFDKPLLRNNMIDLQKDEPEKIYQKIKAFSKPYDGAFIRKGKEKIIIWRGQVETL